VITGAAGITATTGDRNVTETRALPEPLLYVEELGASGVYDALRVFPPGTRLPPGMVTVAIPPFSAAASVEYWPPVMVTDPVGIAPPGLFATDTVTCSV
jgi:hypothetical protein